jgi:class 3 adenylate cyclase
MHRFAVAATAQHVPEQAAALADEAIAAALDAADLLVEHYTQQALHTRLRQNGKLNVRLGINLGATPVPEGVGRELRRAGNLLAAPFLWRQIEANERVFSWDVCDEQVAWGEANDMRVCGGPLMSFDDLSLPDWLGLWEGDLANLVGCMKDFVQRVVERYRGRVDLWHCAARINTGEVLSLSLEDRLRLAVAAAQEVRRLDPKTPAIISFDQPWAEYMNRADTDPPLYVADALLRAGLDVDGLGLEINVGYYPGGSYVHDALDLSQLLDRWSMLGVPLYVFLTVPSGQEPDNLTRGPARPTRGLGPNGWCPREQQQWTERHLPLLLAKPQVHGVIWNQFRDSQPHFFPHGGVLDTDDKVKPLIKTLISLRRKYLT